MSDKVSTSTPKTKATKKKRPRGRPPIPGLPRERIFLRADEDEVAAWKTQADRLGVPLSTWVRMSCNACSRR